MSPATPKRNRAFLSFLVGTDMRLFSDILLTVLVLGASMEPALHNGRAYPVEALSDTAPIQRGDIVLFQFGWRQIKGLPPLVKRVAGVPGDSLSRIGPAPAFVTEPVIPPGFFYVRSDNPTSRYDSRRFGLIHRSQIRGRVIPRTIPP